MTRFAHWEKGEIVAKVVKQSRLTSDCWWVQVWGVKACEGCELKGKPDCGGKAILAKIRNRTFPMTGLPGRVTVKRREKL